MLQASLSARATARPSAILTICGAILPFTFFGVASPIPEKVPLSVVTLALMIAIQLLPSAGVCTSSVCTSFNPCRCPRFSNPSNFTKSLPPMLCTNRESTDCCSVFTCVMCLPPCVWGRPGADPSEKALARLRAENVRLAKKLEQAEVIIEVQKKLSVLLGLSSEVTEKAAVK